MSGKSLVDQIKHYQKDIEKCPNNSERMIRCIQRLYVLPIKVEHLQETGVGRSVNSLRKYKGEVGEAAKALVAKWKAMVAAEESSDEPHEISPSKPQEIKISPPPAPPPNVSSLSTKSESKTDRSKEKSRSSSHSSENKRHHSESKSHSKDSKSHNSTKHRDMSSDKNHLSSSKKSHNSLSNSNNHLSEKKDSSHKNHKSHHDKHRSESPPPKKHKKHHSNSKNHVSSDSSREREPVKSESEDESSSSEESEASAVSEKSDENQSDRDVDEGSASSNSGSESDSSSSSDHRHRSKHKSSRHKHSDSSHHKEKSEVKYKEHKDKSKDKEKSKDHCTNSNSKSDRHSSKKTKGSPDYKELIKENEKKVKKEKDEFVAPKSAPSLKNVKLETNEDGSIDSGSGASFADALLGMDSFSEPKKKKKTPCSSSSSNSSSNSKPSKSSKSHSSNSSGHSVKNDSNSKLSSSSKTRTIDELVEPPELLSKKIKLEALDLDISSTLPEINLNYKPLPHIPESSRRPTKTMTEEAMFSIMTTKNQRTKVYSGNKVYQSTVPSLFSLCIQLLYENIDAVEYTGGVPYNLLKPLLEKLNADQLYVLEHFNPYLIEDTDELWKFHCSKDFRNEKRQDLETWRELYLRCLEEREKKLKALTANITQSMAKSTPVRQAKLAYVDAVVKPPRNVARKQAKYGTGNSTTPSSKNPNKQEIVSKAFVGGNTPGVSVKDVVPTPPPVARAAAHHPTPAIMKKKKAPLMQKAIQVMKSTRFKR